jgi:hypothetical protein
MTQGIESSSFMVKKNWDNDGPVMKFLMDGWGRGFFTQILPTKERKDFPETKARQHYCDTQK